MIKIAILRIFIHSQLHQKYHRVLVCNSERLFALVASKDGETERERDGCKITGERGKGKIFWETQA
jgi:hypothetical protein